MIPAIFVSLLNEIGYNLSINLEPKPTNTDSSPDPDISETVIESFSKADSLKNTTLEKTITSAINQVKESKQKVFDIQNINKEKIIRLIAKYN